MAFTYVTITHTFETAADVSATGEISFTPVEPMHNGVTVVQKAVTATLSGAGVLSQLLAANTDPDTRPTGTTYRVKERIAGQPDITYYVQVPHDAGSVIDLRDLAGWQGGSGGGGGTTGAVTAINGEAPDGAGNVVLSASDVGAQLASAALTRLSAAPVTLTAVSGVITPNASLGTLFRHDATAAVALASPTGPSDGQPLDVQVYASAADRVLSLPNGLTSVTIAAGSTWWGHFSYHQGRDQWLLDDDTGGGGSSSGYTDEQVDDRVAALIVAGTNVTKTYDDVAGTLTISAATTGSSGIPAATVTTKGDLIAATGNAAVARRSVGTDGQALLADSTQATGLSYGAPVPAVHTHTGVEVVVTSSVRTASYTFTAADMGVEQVYNSSSAGTFTVPNDSTAATTTGKSFPLTQFGTGQLTVAAASGVSISSRGGALKLAGQYAVAELRKIGNNAWLLYGDITT